MPYSTTLRRNVSNATRQPICVWILRAVLPKQGPHKVLDALHCELVCEDMLGVQQAFKSLKVQPTFFKTQIRCFPHPYNVGLTLRTICGSGPSKQRRKFRTHRCRAGHFCPDERPQVLSGTRTGWHAAGIIFPDWGLRVKQKCSDRMAMVMVTTTTRQPGSHKQKTAVLVPGVTACQEESSIAALRSNFLLNTFRKESFPHTWCKHVFPWGKLNLGENDLADTWLPKQ